MSVDWLWLANVVLWMLLASQHAFYALGMAAAQRALSAPAYVELRNAIDDVLKRSLPPLYVATLVATVLAVLAAAGPGRRMAVLALGALLVEAWLMLRRSVPINARMQTWSPAAPPDDWQRTRAEWLAVFRERQIAVAIGALATVLGALAR